MKPVTSAEDFRRETGVSRETIERLNLFAGLLQTWNRRINLVSRESLADLWTRHFLDSAQLFPLLPPADGRRVLADFGSGAGFPGLVLSIMGAGEVHLIESDRRKAAFLREAARVTGADAKVWEERLEDLAAFPVDVITARACASLAQLLRHARRFSPQQAGAKLCCLFPKGESVDQELTEISKQERLTVVRHVSCTNPNSTILRINLEVEDANEAIPR